MNNRLPTALRAFALIAFIFALTMPAAAQPPQATLLYLPLLHLPSASPFSFQASTATYLGGQAADSATAVAFSNDGGVVVAGSFPDYSPAGVMPIALLGGGDGAVLRLAPDGRTLRSLTRLGPITDMAVAADDTIVVCGSFGIAALSTDASALRWNAAPGSVARCDVGSDGTAAALVGRTVSLYNGAGAAAGSFTASGTAVNDLAVDGANQQVIVGGYKQDDGGSCGPLQIGFLRAYAYAGAQRWAAYDWNKTQVGGLSLCADTRTRVVSLGADGQIYAANSINGGTGASIYARDPLELARSASDRTVSIDDYTNPFNTGSISMFYVGRYRPADGALLLGQSLLTRRTSDRKGNSIGVKSLAADAAGRLVVVGDAACCIANRDQRQVAGTTVATYGGSEAYLLALSADFRTRLAWAIFTGPSYLGSSHSSALSGVTLRGGKVAAVGTLNNGSQANLRGRLLTYNAFQAEPASLSASEGYMLLWPMP